MDNSKENVGSLDGWLLVSELTLNVNEEKDEMIITGNPKSYFPETRLVIKKAPNLIKNISRMITKKPKFPITVTRHPGLYTLNISLEYSHESDSSVYFDQIRKLAGRDRSIFKGLKSDTAVALGMYETERNLIKLKNSPLEIKIKSDYLNNNAF